MTTGLLVAVCMVLPSPASGQSTAPTVRPGAPGQPSQVVPARAPQTRPRPRHTEADVRFMQGMIPHHAQALDMAALVPTRSSNRAVRALARKIDAGQRDEIAAMERWLQERGEPVSLPGGHQHAHDAHGALMPGMLTPEEMARLAAATGRDFDRLFLTYMIRHHEGALVMVRDLFASPGAAQAPEMFRLASDIDADQRADIRRMQAMLGAAPPPASPPHQH